MYKRFHSQKIVVASKTFFRKGAWEAAATASPAQGASHLKIGAPTPGLGTEGLVGGWGQPLPPPPGLGPGIPGRIMRRDVLGWPTCVCQRVGGKWAMCWRANSAPCLFGGVIHSQHSLEASIHSFGSISHCKCGWQILFH